MYVKSILTLLITILFSMSVNAQSDVKNDNTKEVEAVSQPTGGLKVFSILLYNGPDPMAADSCIELYREKFPQESQNKPRLNMAPPNYSARVGCFGQRLEAYQFLQKIKEVFPTAALIPGAECQ